MRLHRLRWLLQPAVLACSLSLGSGAGWAAYKIQGGDTLSFSVAGLPELSTRAVVDLDGNARLPLIGAVKVSDSSVDEALSRIQGSLQSRQYRRHAEDGRELAIYIAPDDVGLSIDEYRPVYLMGDVAKPGAVAFRPNLTVRNAVALAGGIDRLGPKMDDAPYRVLELMSEYKNLALSLRLQTIRLAGLKSELGGDSSPDSSPDAAWGSLEHPGLGDVVKNESDQLTLRRTDLKKERDFLAEAEREERSRASLLKQQSEKQQSGLKSDLADLERYSGLLDKGAIALPVMSEARRAVLLSADRSTQTSASLASSEREQLEIRRKLERLDDERQLQLLKEQQDVNTSIALAQGKMEAVRDEIASLKSRRAISPGAKGGDLSVHVTRIIDGHPEVLTLSLDSALAPGDDVEVDAKQIPF